MGRFLIIVTFLEDAFTIVTEWSNQLLLLTHYQNSPYCGVYSATEFLLTYFKFTMEQLTSYSLPMSL